jgi:hypothetical protein
MNTTHSEIRPSESLIHYAGRLAGENYEPIDITAPPKTLSTEGAKEWRDGFNEGRGGAHSASTGPSITISGNAEYGEWSETNGDTTTPTLPYHHEQAGGLQTVRLGLVPDLEDLDNGELGLIVASFSLRTSASGYEPDGCAVESAFLRVDGEAVTSGAPLFDRLKEVAEKIAEEHFDETAWRDSLTSGYSKADFRRMDHAEGVE